MTIHYHGTPITPTAILNELHGAHFCVSFAQPQQVEHCHRIGQSVMLDNGAFSVWKRGLKIDWGEFYKWADPWLDHPTTWAVIPDVIEGDEADNDLLCRAWPFRDRGAPVWHMHESWHRLLSLLYAFPRICIGSSAQYAEVMSDPWQRRMDAAWREIDRHFSRPPNIHMLRGMRLVRQRWPFASVDSTDIARNHSAKHNCAKRMRGLWDARQCPPRFDDPWRAVGDRGGMKPEPHAIQIGSLIEFAPNPRWPEKKVRGTVVRWRKDPRGGALGWLDVKCTDDVERSVRANRAVLL